uniref:Putative non-LTR retroelement reverse transcriptase, related n=1 Tax=Medicago truncatula TaxID=3880 RepID=Q1RU68_MEDTR|nr:Putative non-LTR retroelement reverse transcriptase, related [Medicago truncatula]
MKILLISWGNKFLSFGGRIVLLNSVLNAIPIFYLSFLRIPVKVWRRLVRFEREFLWGGVGGGRKISWVKWSKVCQPKDKGGLGSKGYKAC